MFTPIQDNEKIINLANIADVLKYVSNVNTQFTDSLQNVPDKRQLFKSSFRCSFHYLF